MLSRCVCVCVLLSRLCCIPSIHPSSTNSHDMNIQRTTLNRSNGHSFSPSLSPPLLSMNYMCDRKALRILNWTESNEKKQQKEKDVDACRAGSKDWKETNDSSYLIHQRWTRVWMCLMTNRKSWEERERARRLIRPSIVLDTCYINWSDIRLQTE